MEDIKKMTGPLAVQEYIQKLISKFIEIQETIHQLSKRLLNVHLKLISIFGSMNKSGSLF